MDTYKIEIIMMKEVIGTYEFTDKEEARNCFYKNYLRTDRCTKLYINNEEIKSDPAIRKILGSCPRHLWCNPPS